MCEVKIHYAVDVPNEDGDGARNEDHALLQVDKECTSHLASTVRTGLGRWTR
jgi:hypothetical protein